MNLPKLPLRCLLVAFVLGAGFVSAPAGRAQPAPQIGNERYLFIFNTSADMKKRLPAVREEVNQLLATSLGGYLRRGDSIGVWTFDQDLHTGQFPLQFWRPEDAVAVASSINKFVGKQRYAHQTRFSALQPQLNEVIRNSGRLTVLIFCDGEGEFTGTPYDADINRVFQLRQAAQKTAMQPFVLVLRTQLGQYTGCTMNFPPGMVNIPEFPPPPAPVLPPTPAKTPAPAPKPAPAAKPPPIGPPLIIIGTNVETQWPPAPTPAKTTNAVPVMPTNPVVPAKAVMPPPPTNKTPAAVQTNASPAARVISVAPANAAASEKPMAPLLPANPARLIHSNGIPPQRTNVMPQTPVKPGRASPSNSVATLSAVAPPPEAASPGRKVAFVVGVVLLIVAGALAALAVFRRRPDRGSLITRSMRKD